MAHRYWRVLVTGSGGYVGLYALDFQDDSGNSLCVGGNPIASSQYAFYAPARAFPGGATNWIANGEGAGAWIGYDFGHPVLPAKTIITGAGPCGDAPSRIGTAVVQSSDDGAAWSNEYETDQPAGGWPYQVPVEFDTPPPPPPSPAYANFLAYVIPASDQPLPSAGASNAQMAVVLPLHDLPVPSVGAQIQQLAFVFIDREYITPFKPVPIAIKSLWGFPLMIQKGV